MIHFTVNEFECPCCKRVEMDYIFMQDLDAARSVAGVPFRINSGYRCERYNLEIKGSVGSSHLKGLAANIRCKDSTQRFKIVRALIRAGITRIGVAETFIHADSDPGKPNELIWTY